MIGFDIIRRPLTTEKSNLQKETLHQLTFEVHPMANRVEIKKAIENIFKVTVKSVRTMNVKGKARRMGSITGRRKNWKKAIVAILPDDRIDFFEGA